VVNDAAPSADLADPSASATGLTDSSSVTIPSIRPRKREAACTSAASDAARRADWSRRRHPPFLATMTADRDPPYALSP